MRVAALAVPSASLGGFYFSLQHPMSWKLQRDDCSLSNAFPDAEGFSVIGWFDGGSSRLSCASMSTHVLGLGNACR